MFGRFAVHSRHYYPSQHWSLLAQGHSVTSQDRVSQTFMLADPSWIKKITTDLHILAHINMEFLDDRYPKSKTYISVR
jgi:hypothetical protein